MCAHHSWATTSHKLPSIQMTKFFQSKLEPLVTDHILWATVTPGPRAVTTFWADSFIIIHFFKPLVRDRLTHGLISMFTVCSALLRHCEESITRKRNYTHVRLIIYQKVYVSRAPLGRDHLWPDSRKRPLTLRILGSRLREVLLF